MSKNIYIQLISFTLLCICTSLFSQEKLDVEGAIIIKNSESAAPVPGTIRWQGKDFEGWNGQRWVSLTGYATPGTVTDIDGNTYQTSRIGNREWMVENLRVTKYSDNTSIDQITDNATWAGLLTGAWCWYNNDNIYEVPYGKLYNWYAVNSGKLCPTGWQVPSDTEWTTLTDFLGGESSAGGRMKEIGLTHWITPNAGATNESGFTGLPGGYRYSNGTFFLQGRGNWWSRTPSGSNAWYRILSTYDVSAGRFDTGKSLGFSVRCVKD